MRALAMAITWSCYRSRNILRLEFAPKPILSLFLSSISVIRAVDLHNIDGRFSSIHSIGNAATHAGLYSVGNFEKMSLGHIKNLQRGGRGPDRSSPPFDPLFYLEGTVACCPQPPVMDDAFYHTPILQSLSSKEILLLACYLIAGCIAIPLLTSTSSSALVLLTCTAFLSMMQDVHASPISKDSGVDTGGEYFDASQMLYDRQPLLPSFMQSIYAKFDRRALACLLGSSC
jgi:hypothetical protein